MTSAVLPISSHANAWEIVKNVISKIDEKMKIRREETKFIEHNLGDEFNMISHYQSTGFGEKETIIVQKIPGNFSPIKIPWSVDGKVLDWRYFKEKNTWSLVFVPITKDTPRPPLVEWNFVEENKMWQCEGYHIPLEEVVNIFAKNPENIATKIPTFISSILYQMMYIFSLFESENYYYELDLSDFWVDHKGKIKFKCFKTDSTESVKELQPYFVNIIYEIINLIIESFSRVSTFDLWKKEHPEIDGLTVCFLVTLREFLKVILLPTLDKHAFSGYRSKANELFLHSFLKDLKVPFLEPIFEIMPKSIVSQQNEKYETELEKLSTQKKLYESLYDKFLQIPSCHQIVFGQDPYRRTPETQIYRIYVYSCRGNLELHDLIPCYMDVDSDCSRIKPLPESEWCDECLN